MLPIAAENNLSEITFAVKISKDKREDSENKAGYYKFRWFTPGGEIDLCGHTTLAYSCVIMNYYEKDLGTIVFDTLSEELTVNRKRDAPTDIVYEPDFHGYDLKSVEIAEEIIELIGEKPVEAYLGRDLIYVLEDENFVLKVNLYV